MFYIYTPCKFFIHIKRILNLLTNPCFFPLPPGVLAYIECYHPLPPDGATAVEAVAMATENQEAFQVPLGGSTRAHLTTLSETSASLCLH